MTYTLFKVSKLKNEDDFLKAIDEKNTGSVTYYKCIDYINNQPYYNNHKIRKNGIIAIWLHFEYHFDGTEKKTSLESWKSATDSWTISNILKRGSKTFFSKNSEHKYYYRVDRIFIFTDEKGKLAYEKLFSGEMRWLITIQRAYYTYMRALFGTQQAPKSIYKDFLNNNVTNLESTNVLPKPRDGESVIDYYERVKLYDNEKRLSKNKKEDDIKGLIRENNELKKQHKEDLKNLKRFEKYKEIADEYPDIRTLNSHLVTGKRVKAAYIYYNNEKDTDTCTYIKTLLEYGRQILESAGQ